jgi:hypothetical protein
MRNDRCRRSTELQRTTDFGEPDHRGVTDTCLARPGLANLNLLPDEHLRAAGLVKTDGMDHLEHPLGDVHEGSRTDVSESIRALRTEVCIKRG